MGRGLLFREVFFSYSTEGAYPIGRKVLKGRSGFDTIVRITYCGVVDITADIAYILFHFLVILRG